MMTLTNKAQWLATLVISGRLDLGSFNSSIMGSYAIADSSNRARIEQAFKDMIEKEFSTWHKRVE